ncbi:MAG: hypothetical protein JW702_02680 [Clostridiales bacterium]|nr:hypothetical protein [Clostridiales bacterium]
MGLFLTGIIALGIGYYVFAIIRKSSKNVKAGKCISCDGHCSDSSCEVNINHKK